MRRIGVLMCLALLLQVHCTSTFGQEKAKPADTKQRMASEAIARLEKQIAEKKAPVGTMMVASSASNTTQDKLNKEHEKARREGYDREFHDAIRKNGGERLKEEWKKNCRARPTKPDQRELNCY